MQGSQVHISIKTAKFAESVAFYSRLFGVDAVKLYDDYAKFVVEAPSMNITLNKVASQPQEQAIDHLGIVFDGRADIARVIRELQIKGLAHEVQEETSCCYGVQDKVWVADPNGIRWELYAIVVADTGDKACSMEPVALPAAAGAC
ncbi:MAG: VOC family protein [Planctomycetes bacterium]|nr:VOC family protein [Planctomycetota bacterium]